MDEYSTNSNDDLLFSLIVGLFLLEIAVGAIQILGALIRTIICINNKQAIGKLKTYWIMVGIYFLVFAGLYFAENYIISHITINYYSDTGNYLDRLKLYQYFMFAHVAWIILAWGIAIWYCIKIIFVKHKSTIEINHSLTQKL
ncbi:MAG: hypothetical protein IPH32_08840 [Bacteroidetes bacterium]|nr:hypothetical protein [Bacteroidota bacterium]